MMAGRNRNPHLGWSKDWSRIINPAALPAISGWLRLAGTAPHAGLCPRRRINAASHQVAFFGSQVKPAMPLTKYSG